MHSFKPIYEAHALLNTTLICSQGLSMDTMFAKFSKRNTTRGAVCIGHNQHWHTDSLSRGRSILFEKGMALFQKP
eukprot:889587-Pelagomonas_calceolata.AAC.4